jgi:hypothetical protein
MKVGIIDFDQGDKNVKAVHDKSGGFALGCVLDGGDDVPAELDDAFAVR